MQKNIFGKKGELIASSYLENKGYKIIANNYKNKIGEIDIIAKDGNVLVFVEVKTRLSSMFGMPIEAVDDKKQRKIRLVAEVYLNSKKLKNVECRFDVVGILGEEEEEIEHIVDAF
ncbi:MAG: YraN family protein [Candidatus Onthoplasma sp.]